MARKKHGLGWDTWTWSTVDQDDWQRPSFVGEDPGGDNCDEMKEHSDSMDDGKDNVLNE